MSRSRVTHQLMRICAARLDENVTADEFVELINGLIDMCAQTFGDEPDDDEDAGPDPVLISPASGEAEKTNTGRRKDGTTWSRKPKLTDEDREAIRADYQRAKADGDTISEWMEMTALEYGVATNTLKNVCYRQGD